MNLQKNPPARDAKYLDFLETIPCCICHRIRHIQALSLDNTGEIRFSVSAPHHYGKTGKGTAQKCSDHETVPICDGHHKELHQKGRKRFALKYGIEIPAHFDEVAGIYLHIWQKKKLS